MKLLKKIFTLTLLIVSMIIVTSCEEAVIQPEQPKEDLFYVVYPYEEDLIEISEFNLSDILIYTTNDGMEVAYPASEDNITYADYLLLKTPGAHVIKIIYNGEIHEVIVLLKESSSSTTDPITPDNPTDSTDPVDPVTPVDPTPTEPEEKETTTLTFTSTSIPSDYYTSTIGLSGTTLKSELRSIISVVTHDETYGELRYDLAKTDASTTSGKIRLFYTGDEVSSTWDGGTTWNREHVWPTSKGWWSKPNNSTSNAGTDIHQIRPASSSGNSSRGNTAFGESNGYYQVDDEFKGDVARIIMYMLVRYSEADSASVTSVIESFDMLLKWNELDPVDSYEIARNNAAYLIQGNRNPFIDCPDYANLIWK